MLMSDKFDLTKLSDAVTEADLFEIEQYASGLSEADCLDFLMIEPAEMSEFDARMVRIAHKRGRAGGIQRATEKLFQSMSFRNGGPVASEYLNNMSGEFSVEAVPKGGNSGFSFKVVMPKDE